MFWELAASFWQLIATPFLHITLVWGVVPLYVAWLSNEGTPAKRSFRTAAQTGFSFIWSAAQWFWRNSQMPVNPQTVMNLWVTLAVGALGVMALWSGLRRRYPKGFKFLGHARFGNYVMIAIYPAMSGWLGWTVERAAAVVVFAPLTWVLVHLALTPLRR